MQFHLEDMTCGGCARSVTKAIGTVDPKAQVTADPVTKKVRIESDLPPENFRRALEAAGFPPAAA